MKTTAVLVLSFVIASAGFLAAAPQAAPPQKPATTQAAPPAQPQELLFEWTLPGSAGG